VCLLIAGTSLVDAALLANVGAVLLALAATLVFPPILLLQKHILGR
jgi:hypothetical protein